MSDDFQTFRDPLLSIYQSVVSDVAKQIDSKKQSGPRTARATLRRSASGTLPNIAADIADREYRRNLGLDPSVTAGPATRDLSKTDASRVCAELTLRYMKAQWANDAAALAELDGEFTASTCDPAWAKTIKEYVRFFGATGDASYIPYIRAAKVGPKTIEIKADARVALMGDWGTGAQPAIEVLKQIAAVMPDVVIHLGDIYYSGTPLECKMNFSDLIQGIVRNGGRKPDVFTLAGNHDMYCGGVGYYELIKTLNSEPSVQPASFFCLRSADERWQFLAMDTGLHDYKPLSVTEALTFIEEDELAWHCDRIEEFKGKTVLLSHHQLFSAYSSIGIADKDGKRSPTNPNLLKAFDAMRASGQVVAWFWGHEHTLSIYQPFAELSRGRCLGHGAVPTSVIDKIYEPVSGLTQIPAVIENTQLKTMGGVYAHGYAVLKFDGDSFIAQYFQNHNGRPDLVFSETIV